MAFQLGQRISVLATTLTVATMALPYALGIKAANAASTPSYPTKNHLANAAVTPSSGKEKVTALSAEQKQRIQTIRQEERRKISAVLKPEQRTKLDKLLQSHQKLSSALNSLNLDSSQRTQIQSIQQAAKQQIQGVVAHK
ncbi:MAG TPA: hypothetical protein VK211_14805 [Kamptonema sp.]|nr:hypothetical protein [Kamptonema sp.]